MQNIIKKFQKVFVRQQDQSDCGVACLLTLIKFYGGDNNLEKLRVLSGTSQTGTTMLGLYQAGQQVGFEASGFQSDIENLKKHSSPAILHVLIDGQLQHYVIYLGFSEKKFFIYDPAFGIKNFTDTELNTIWKSKTLLQLIPSDKFQKIESIKSDKNKWFLDQIKEDYNLIYLSIILGIIVTVLGQSSAIFTQKLIDDILPSGDVSKLIFGLSLLTFMLLIKIILLNIRQNILLKQSVDFNNRIIHSFYKALLFLPKYFFDHRKTGELIARMNDTSKIQGTISYLSGNVAIDILAVIISTIFVFFYSKIIGFVFVATIPIYFLIVFRFNRPTMEAQKSVMVSYAKTESNYIDTIQGVSVIKETNMVNDFSKVNQIIYGDYQNQLNKLGLIQLRLNYWAEFAGVSIVIFIFGLTSFFVLDKTILIGEMMAIIGISSLALPAIARLALINVQIQSAKIAFDRMFDFISIEPEYKQIVSGDSRVQLIDKIYNFRVESLSFRFPGRKSILKNISFEVNSGEMIVLLGESASGKSTCLQLLQRFYKPEKGEIEINGKSVIEFEIPVWRQLLGVVPQQIKIFNGTVLDNICLVNSSEQADSIIEFCKIFGFEHYINQLPQSYFTIIGEEGINLSGGQLQLIGLARALYKKPKILLLDESTSAMDRHTELFIMNILKKLKIEIPIVMVTHRLHIAKQADRIYVIENGETKLFGQHFELMKTSNVYSKWWQETTI